MSTTSYNSPEELEEMVDRQSRELENTKAAVGQLQDEIDRLSAEKHDAESQLESAYDELENASKLIERASRQIKNRDDQITELRAQINRQRRNLSDMRKQLQILKKEAGATSNKASALQMARLTKELAKVKNDLAEARDLHEQEPKSSDHQSFMEEKSELIQAYETRLQNLSSERQGLRNVIRYLRKSNYDNAKSVESLNATLNAEKANVEAVREELAASQESLNAMHIEKQKVESNLASANRQIEDLNEFKKKEHDDLVQKAFALEHEVNLSKKSIRDQNESLEQAEAQLTAKADQLEADLNEMKEVLRSTNSELEVREAVADSLRQAYQIAEKSRGELESEIDLRDKEESLMGSWAKYLLRTMSKI